jgi:hypothetical protein
MSGSGFFCHTQWCKQNISKSNLCRNRMYKFERLVVDAITQVLKLEVIVLPTFLYVLSSCHILQKKSIFVITLATTIVWVLTNQQTNRWCGFSVKHYLLWVRSFDTLSRLHKELRCKWKNIIYTMGPTSNFQLYLLNKFGSCRGY